MEHEVFVPVPAERLREVLDDPARVARVVPGLQQDAGAQPVAGRLKIRVGSHSVTYRGAVRVSRRDDGAYAVEGEAEESRGSGSVKLALRIGLREAEDGCTVAFDGTASADGRIKDLPADAVEGAVVRLLNRFAEHLAEAAPETTTSVATQDFEPRATTDHETTPDADDEAPPPAKADGGTAAAGDGDDEGAGPPRTAGTAGPAGTAGKPSATGSGGGSPASGTGDESPAPAPDDEAPAPEPPSVSDADVPSAPVGPSAKGDDDAESIAEAAHARRTMIGRSAEEVDHAPPRGRYAPVPAPQTVTPPAPLRWAAPAAALAVASAIVAVRALRRRR
ncbi:SRPBCC domain-containing protein [Streptomyces violaceus]|uniref:SRPBCC domain-containing protein n=1 Tax=Streptomyces violaceus TaxID=1936 RepID=A0ABY9U9X8_STRVL|nr:SRPBCC domain-containing protein [Streptomyces janthinus]WND19343.1 SRPBCC domain-containing protein [Streptomyces janthinus]